MRKGYKNQGKVIRIAAKSEQSVKLLGEIQFIDNIRLALEVES